MIHLSDFLIKKNVKKKLIVASGEEESLLFAINQAIEKELVEPLIIGNKTIINDYINKNEFLNLNNIEIINEKDPEKICEIAVDIVSSEDNCILMKGLATTKQIVSSLLRQKEKLVDADILSHISIFESPYYHKLFGMSDAAINISPSVKEKINIIKNAVAFFHKIGCKQPKVAILSAIEKVNEKIASSVDAFQIKKYFENNQTHDFLVDGPLALDNAMCQKSVENKKIISSVAGDADILIVPEIVSGNIYINHSIF